MPADPSLIPVRRSDYVLVGLFCFVLFGLAMFAGRPLSMHEARLPQTSREMMQNRDWLIPRSGGRPWLERPPLPHWITVATSMVLGQKCDSVWVVRLPATLMGMSIVLCTLFIAGRLLGRGLGVVSALVLATSYELYKYSTLAEDDIFLAAVVVAAMACFVVVEFREPSFSQRTGFFRGRPWPVLGFFVLLGLSNLAKGPLVGTAVAAGSCGAYLLLQIWRPVPLSLGTPGERVRGRSPIAESASIAPPVPLQSHSASQQSSADDTAPSPQPSPPAYQGRGSLARYVWFWGWLAYAIIAVAWPVYIMHRYPEIRENWLFDYGATDEFDQKFWYYPVQLLGCLAPWTPAVLVGIFSFVWPSLSSLSVLGERVRREAQWSNDPAPAAQNPLPGPLPQFGANEQEAPAATGDPAALDYRHPSTPFAARPPRLCPAARFILCWAIVPVLILSIPHRKHHHYLVPSLAPWAIVAAIGLPWFTAVMFRGVQWSRRPRFGLLVIGLPLCVAIAIFNRKIPGPTWAITLLGAALLFCIAGFYQGLYHRRRDWVFGSFLLGVVVCIGWAQAYIPEDTADDTAFLAGTKKLIQLADVDVAVNGDLHGELDFFRNMFYLGPRAHLIHNLTFLRDSALPSSPTNGGKTIFVLTRFKDLPFLQTLGQVDVVLQSRHTRRESSTADRFTLFYLTFRPDLQRYPAPSADSISTMEAMGRKKGPYCGPPLPGVDK